MDTTLDFDGLFTPSCIKELISQFVNFVLYQRGQIPFPFDSFQDHVKALNASAADITSSKVITNGVDVQDVRSRQHQLRREMKRKKEAHKKARNALKLNKKLLAFADLRQIFEEHLSAVLDTGSWESGVQVALLLGATLVSPRETYVLEFPPTDLSCETHPARLQHRRGVRQLFRMLVTSSPLLEVTSRTLSVTNLHLLVWSRPAVPLVPRPAYSFRRGTLLRIRLTSSASLTSSAESVTSSSASLTSSAESETSSSSSLTSSANSVVRSTASLTSSTASLMTSAVSVTSPRPVAAVRPCCGRAPPRRLQPCCATVAAEMGLKLLDASITPQPPPAAPRLLGMTSPVILSSVTSPPQASVTSSCITPELSVTSEGSVAKQDVSDGEEDPTAGVPLEPIWCQIPVVLRGFKAPRTSRRSNNWVATNE